MEWLPVVTAWINDALLLHREMVLRLFLAAALGGMIGLEREASGKPAGFRTNLLICLGAALIMEISRKVAADTSIATGVVGDPGRIAAQIVSGIGFLGAGTIMQSRGGIVTGLTTAATLWVVAAIGMAVGAQFYIPALIATALVMITLMILGRVEDHLLPHRAADRTIQVDMLQTEEILADVEAILTAAGLAVTGLEVERRDGQLLAAFYTRGMTDSFDRIVQRLLARDGVRRVAII
jgi:putative Mg2+ transporter-C (MgtC) family protein